MPLLGRPTYGLVSVPTKTSGLVKACGGGGGGGARNLNWGQKKNVLRFIVDKSAGSDWHRAPFKAVTG